MEAWYLDATGAAAGIFAAAAVTDFVDGYLARRLNQSSSLGALLDPLADKLLLAGTLLLLVEHSGAAAVTVPAALILSREVAVSSLREWMQAYRPQAKAEVAVAWHGKAKAAMQFLALQGMLIGVALGHGKPVEVKEGQSREEAEAAAAWADTVYLGSTALLWAATLVTLGSGAQYARAAFIR